MSSLGWLVTGVPISRKTKGPHLKHGAGLVLCEVVQVKANPRTANGAARRKVRAQVLAEETHCGICGQPVDKTLSMQWGQHSPRCTDQSCPGCVPHPMRPEVDEIVPVHRGGSPYERSNCRLSHRKCNVGRNRTRPAPPPREPYRTSRDWTS